MLIDLKRGLCSSAMGTMGRGVEVAIVGEAGRKWYRRDREDFSVELVLYAASDLPLRGSCNETNI